MRGFFGPASDYLCRPASQPIKRRSTRTVVAANNLGDVRVLVPPEAVAEILAQRADVLVVDVNQQSQDVLSLMRTATLTNVRRPVPVIVTGAHDAADRIEACLQRGATDYLITPFDAKHAPSPIVRRLEGLGASSQPARQLPMRRKRIASPALPSARSASAHERQSRTGHLRDDVHRFVAREYLELLAHKCAARDDCGSETTSNAR